MQNMGETSDIFQSAYKGDYDLIYQIATAGDIKDIKNKVDSNGRTVLHWAAISGNLRLVDFLLDSGFELDVQDDTLTTPLILAASAGRTEVVQTLLSHGAGANKQTEQGHSALQYACSKGWLEISEMLLSNGADINIRDIRGSAPLHRAASKGNIDIVKCLLKNDKILEINLQDSYGSTALHLACEEDRKEEAQLLVAHNADTSILDKDKRSPLDLCSSSLARLLTGSK